VRQDMRWAGPKIIEVALAAQINRDATAEIGP
jgi:hypothetical protein